MVMPTQHIIPSGDATSIPYSSRTSACDAKRVASPFIETGSASITSKRGCGGGSPWQGIPCT